MKKNRLPLDAFVVSGFVAAFFSGFLNPLYVGLILSHLDGRIIAIGSFMSSAFPVLIGVALGNRAVFQRLYAALPVVMIVELIIGGGSALLAAVDVRAYYLVSMFIGGTCSSSVIYLLQKIKEVRYRRGRASFDRRVDMADAAGLLAGSALSVAGYSLFRNPLHVAVLAAVQTGIVYGLFLVLYRRVPERRGKRADQEPHPWWPAEHESPICAPWGRPAGHDGKGCAPWGRPAEHDGKGCAPRGRPQSRGMTGVRGSGEIALAA